MFSQNSFKAYFRNYNTKHYFALYLKALLMLNAKTDNDFLKRCHFVEYFVKFYLLDLSSVAQLAQAACRVALKLSFVAVWCKSRFNE